jgi:cobalt-zinc-cadmium efflux system protein
MPSHHHHHGLNAAFWLTAVFAVVELVGGLMANSLALLADAGHMTSDVAALGLSMFAARIAQRPANAQMSYGYGRAKVLAAQMNGLMLWFLAGWIVWEAVARFNHPPLVEGQIVLWIAAVGLFINFIAIYALHGGHGLNTRAAYWHVWGDALGSVAAIVAGSVIMLTGWMLIDPLLSFLVAAILIWGGWRLVHETTLELMEAVPQEVNIEAIQQALLRIEYVKRIYHIHIWRLPNQQLALSAHIAMNHREAWSSTLPILLQTLQQQGIEHATLQPDFDTMG